MNSTSLIHAYLDDALTAEQASELNRWLRSAPEHRNEFVKAVQLHDLIQQHFAGRERLSQAGIVTPVTTQPAPGSRQKNFLPWLSSIMSIFLVVMALAWWGTPAPLSAASELDRLIQSSGKLGDRTYRIRNLDVEAETYHDRRPPIDGALLHVRQPDCYVLIRRYPDQQLFITGCDGERSWSVPPTGAVRASWNPLRFRGPVPGHQHGLPFVDLHSDLKQLHEAYHLQVLQAEAGLQGLQAEKKSAEYRGARRIEIRYDTAGVIRRMIFDGMPQARGGPNRLLVEWQSQEPLTKNFFQHESHHGADRQVIEEDRHE